MSAPPAKFDAEKADNFEDVSFPPSYSKKCCCIYYREFTILTASQIEKQFAVKGSHNFKAYYIYPAIDPAVSCSAYVYILGNPRESPRICFTTHKD